MARIYLTELMREPLVKFGQMTRPMRYVPIPL